MLLVQVNNKPDVGKQVTFFDDSKMFFATFLKHQTSNNCLLVTDLGARKLSLIRRACGSKLNIVASELKGQPFTDSFYENPTEALNGSEYSVATSPSLTTGVDLQGRFDEVFVYAGNSFTPQAAIQAATRERQWKRMYIYTNTASSPLPPTYKEEELNPIEKVKYRRMIRKHEDMRYRPYILQSMLTDRGADIRYVSKYRKDISPKYRPKTIVFSEDLPLHVMPADDPDKEVSLDLFARAIVSKKLKLKNFSKHKANILNIVEDKYPELTFFDLFDKKINMDLQPVLFIPHGFYLPKRMPKDSIKLGALLEALRDNFLLEFNSDLNKLADNKDFFTTPPSRITAKKIKEWCGDINNARIKIVANSYLMEYKQVLGKLAHATQIRPNLPYIECFDDVTAELLTTEEIS